MWFVYMFSCTIWLGHNFTHLQQSRPPTLRELSIGEGSWNLFLLKLYKRVWVNIWRRPPTLYRWTVRINKPPPSFLVGDGAREHLKLCCKELELQTDEAKSRWVHRPWNWWSQSTYLGNQSVLEPELWHTAGKEKVMQPSIFSYPSSRYNLIFTNKRFMTTILHWKNARWLWWMAMIHLSWQVRRSSISWPGRAGPSHDVLLSLSSSLKSDPALT